MVLITATGDATIPLPDITTAREDFLASLNEDLHATAATADPEREDLLIALGLRHA